MNAIEYYDLPYGVADRMELQNFLIAGHYEGDAKDKAKNHAVEPQSTNEILTQWLFQLTHNVKLTGSAQLETSTRK